MIRKRADKARDERTSDNETDDGIARELEKKAEQISAPPGSESDVIPSHPGSDTKQTVKRCSVGQYREKKNRH